MSQSDVIHIVTSLVGLSGAETHAATLRDTLKHFGKPVQLWSDRQSSATQRYGGTPISPFSGQMPRGGVLVLVGTFLALEPWIAYAHPRRVVLVCINSDPLALQQFIGRLKQASLPSIELVYVSSRLRDAMGIPGRLCPEIIDLDKFSPRATPPAREGFIVGRLSRDVPEKHHPDDPSLYKLLTWQSMQVRVMGGTCIAPHCERYPAIDIVPAGAEPAPDFLRSLDVFFYRTSPQWHEPSGRVVMEALASGLPVVAHTSGGYTDWIEPGENGFVCSNQEEALDQLLRISKNPELRGHLSSGARATALKRCGLEAASEYAEWLVG